MTDLGVPPNVAQILVAEAEAAVRAARALHLPGSEQAVVCRWLVDMARCEEAGREISAEERRELARMWAVRNHWRAGCPPVTGC